MRFGIIIFSLFMLFFSSAFSQNGIISIGSIDGQTGPFEITTDQEIIFSMKFINNTGSDIYGFTNGFKIYSPDGATWNTSIGDTTGILGLEEFNLAVIMDEFGITGSGIDTLGLGMVSLFGPGMVDGFDDYPYTITIGPIDPIHEGKTICIDSSFFPPSGTWLWSSNSSGSFQPDWNGPFCYTITPPPVAFFSLDNVEGAIAPDTLLTDTPIRFDIRLRYIGDGIIIRGIDIEQEKKTSQIIQNVTIGDCSFEPIIEDDDTIPGMIIGTNLADRLGVYLGSSVFLYSLKGEDLQRNSRPRVAKHYITGILETGMYDFDAQMAYVSIESAQKLFRTGDVATTIHLKLDDVFYAPEISAAIDSTLGFKYDVVPWYELHRNLFEWIEIEKKVLFLGFILIVLVAAFSIISTLVLLTMEKRSEIGILKTMGSTPFSIIRIFVSKGLSIATYGVVLGWILALASAYLQNHYKLINLPADIYFISYLPIETHLLDFIVAGGVTFVICFVASLYPAYQASRVSVIEVLRK